jgi:cell division protein ZapA (FtsZ GTPase activity inhibitor)
MPNSITIHIAGQPLKVLTDRDQAYLDRLVQHIDHTLLTLQRSPQPSTRPSPQVLLLALLRLADELFEAHNHTNALKDLLQQRADSIIRLLDGAPPSSPP